MTRWSALLLSAALTLGACQSLSPVRDTPTGPVDVIAHDLAITPDFKRRTITGRQTMVVRGLADGVQAIGVSASALKITSATMDGQPLTLKWAGERMIIVLPRPLANGERVRLDFAYQGRPRRGLTFARQSVHTDYFACDWMICDQDAPGDKAEITLTLMLPPGMTSLGPGEHVATVPAGRAVAHRWRAERPYSAYVYGFAAGRYATLVHERDGGAITTYSATVGPKALVARFALTPEIAAFFIDKAGLPLQHPYAQLHVAGDAAQESVGFSVIGEEAIGPILSDAQEDWAIAHELAHQWWGNLVTCADWSQFWLNEGVTTFMVAAWKEHKWGRGAYDREMALLSERVAKAKARGVDHKLTYAGDYPSLALKRAIA